MFKRQDKIADRKVLLPAQAARQLDRLQLTASRFLPGMGAGLRASLRRQVGADFREHRAYVPGDELRYVDWKASARQEHIYVKQAEHPREISVYILLDNSASMGWGTPPKKTAALSLAASLGYLALSHGDRLGVYSFAAELGQNLGPVSGKGQVPTFLKYLSDMPFEGTSDLEQAIQSFSRQPLQGGLVLIISDLLGVEGLDATLAKIPSPGWDVILFHLLHPEEISPTHTGNEEFVDIETGEAANYDINEAAIQEYQKRMADWQQRLDLECVENNAFYTLIQTDWSLTGEIIPHLRKNHVLTPLQK